jgi:hypothetical protein
MRDTRCMTEHSLWFTTLVIATVIDGLLAGASLDQSVEQLPARHRIGVRAYSAYSRASHAANGRFWLIPLGVGGAALTLATAIWAQTLELPGSRTLPLFIAGGLAIAHTLTTIRAATINVRQWRGTQDDEHLAGILDRFERWQSLRAALQFFTFGAAVWALAVNALARG